MGIDAGIEVEGADDLYEKGIDRINGRLFADIVIDISEGEGSVTNDLAEKYGFNAAPLGNIDGGEHSECGPWMDPLDLWEAAYGLFDAFAKEGAALLEREVCYRPMDSELATAYMTTLSEAVDVLKYAHESGKRVRLTVG